LFSSQVIAVTMDNTMSTIIADHWPPVALDLHLELHHELDHLAPLGPVIVALLSNLQFQSPAS
jgi:hypothetical protein